ncbi:MAG: hypothetical protein HQL90_07390 [Magnetococcales bacterium]|nr:hypothetical protein [Magnetococcales bacterium]
MKLVNGSTVAIAGGGPAGTLTAIFLLDLAAKMRISLAVDIYEPKIFSATGPKGCNMCGGVISESLMQLLATEGILLPPSVVIDTINAYILHTDEESARIEAPRQEMRIATIFRGAGPQGSEKQQPLPWKSFDLFLLELALQKGARHLPHAVIGLERREGRPSVITASAPPLSYDLLVGAVGINQSKNLQLFESFGFGYIRPQTTRAYVGELYLGAETVQSHLGHAMHVFLLNIPHLKFAAITPKGHYATLILLGDQIDAPLVEQFFQAPEVRKCLPEGWEIPVQPCHCQPQIQIGPPVHPFGDRVVMVGDACVSRLYKDGIGAAHRLAKRCALTALVHGVSEQDFNRHYWPSCRGLLWDNRLGHLLFAMDHLFRSSPLLRRGLMGVLKQEHSLSGHACPLSSAFWNTFTGSASYTRIARDMLRPTVLWRLLRTTASSLFQPQRGAGA